MRVACFLMVLGLVVPIWAPVAAAQTASAREITELAPGLYRARDGGYTTVFVVSSEGIILADPIGTATATWLRDEFEQRFGVPVRYVIYSHDHWDHARGGAVFDDTAQFIGHANILRNMDAAVPMLPGGVRDRNGNGQFDRDETDAFFGENFDAFDVNGDGGVRSSEYFREIRRPDRTYEDELTVILGDKTVRLVHVPPNHSADTTAILFPDERIVFLADTFNGRSIPNPWGDFDSNPLSSWIAAFTAVEALPWDRLVPGHGPTIATKAEVAAKREFLEALVAAVSAGIAEGKSVEMLTAEITLPAYADWNNYDSMAAAVEAAYVNLTTLQ